MPSEASFDEALPRKELIVDIMFLAVPQASTGPSAAGLGSLAKGRLTEPGSQRWLDGTETSESFKTDGLIFNWGKKKGQYFNGVNRQDKAWIGIASVSEGVTPRGHEFVLI